MSFLSAIGNGITTAAHDVSHFVAPGTSIGGQFQNLSPSSMQTHALAPPQYVLGAHTSSAPQNSAQKPAPVQAAPNSTYGGVSAGNGSSGYSSSFNPGNPDAINAAYDVGKNWYTGYRDLLDPQEQQQQGDINNQYQDSVNSIEHQRNAALTDLDNQGHVLNDQYGRSLSQLGNNVRNQLQGQSNALGVAGAGDSSAQNMLAYALSQLHNQQRGYMNQDLNHQMTQIASTRVADNNQYDDAAKAADHWKQQQYDAIHQGYVTLRQQIDGSLAGNEQARASALNYAGQWAANKMASVDQTIADNLADLKNRVFNIPQADLSKVPTYQAQNINPGTLDVSASLQKPVTPTDVAQVAAPLLPKKDPNAPINPAF